MYYQEKCPYENSLETYLMILVFGTKIVSFIYLFIYFFIFFFVYYFFPVLKVLLFTKIDVNPIKPMYEVEGIGEV